MESLVKSQHDANFLVKDLRELVNDSVRIKNDALYVLALQLLEQGTKIEQTLLALKNV